MGTRSIPIDSIAEVQNAVRAARKVFPVGNGTKTALSVDAAGNGDVTLLAMGSLSGVIEYQPDEYTFTALAGTSVATVEAHLAEHGQYLPFDPPLNQHGATLGGTVASGLSGSGRYRYGGVRDFFIGTRFVDGRGDLILGGGKVVKNAAGFDTPKLLVGSLGRLGILVEVTFKVFPQPKAYRTLVVPCDSVRDAVEIIGKLAAAPFELDALDIDVSAPSNPLLTIRVGGPEKTLADRIERLQAQTGPGKTSDGRDEQNLWNEVRNFFWLPQTSALVKVPLSPGKLVHFDGLLESAAAPRRYAVGGHLCWIAWPHPTGELDHLLARAELPGLLIQRGKITGDSASVQGERTNPGSPYLGNTVASIFAQRIKSGIDPDERFLPL